MANRTTAKSNITALNVPTVTNTILNNMLLNELADNVSFREDVATVQTSVVSSITVDFTGKERIDLTRTGGSLAITVAGMGDGETKFLLITKTAGQVVSFVGVTDITPVKTNADALSLVLYQIVRKGSNYFAWAWVETVKAASDINSGVLVIASDVEHKALSSTTKAVVPGRIPIATETQQGLLAIATTALAQAYTDDDAAMTALKTKQFLDAVVSAQLMTLTGKIASITVNLYDARKIGRLIHFEINAKSSVANSELKVGEIPGYVPLHGNNCFFSGNSILATNNEPSSGYITQGSNIFLYFGKANTDYVFNFDMIV